MVKCCEFCRAGDRAPQEPRTSERPDLGSPRRRPPPKRPRGRLRLWLGPRSCASRTGLRRRALLGRGAGQASRRQACALGLQLRQLVQVGLFSTPEVALLRFGPRPFRRPRSRIAPCAEAVEFPSAWTHYPSPVRTQPVRFGALCATPGTAVKKLWITFREISDYRSESDRYGSAQERDRR